MIPKAPVVATGVRTSPPVTGEVRKEIKASTTTPTKKTINKMDEDEVFKATGPMLEVPPGQTRAEAGLREIKPTGIPTGIPTISELVKSG